MQGLMLSVLQYIRLRVLQPFAATCWSAMASCVLEALTKSLEKYLYIYFTVDIVLRYWSKCKQLPQRMKNEHQRNVGRFLREALKQGLVGEWLSCCDACPGLRLIDSEVYTYTPCPCTFPVWFSYRLTVANSFLCKLMFVFP